MLCKRLFPCLYVFPLTSVTQDSLKTGILSSISIKPAHFLIQLCVSIGFPGQIVILAVVFLIWKVARLYSSVANAVFGTVAPTVIPHGYARIGES